MEKNRTDGREGFDMLHEVLKLDPDAVVILMTAFTETEKVVRAIKEGASDFIEKPWDRSRLLSILFSGIQLRQERRNSRSNRRTGMRRKFTTQSARN